MRGNGRAGPRSLPLIGLASNEFGVPKRNPPYHILTIPAGNACGPRCIEVILLLELCVDEDLKFLMPKRISARLLAVVLVLAVFALGVEAAGHWHNNPIDEQHCQVCHVGHVAFPVPVVQATVAVPLPFARITPPAVSTFSPEAVNTLSIPRAPPV
jgi:hypothetical protein